MSGEISALDAINSNKYIERLKELEDVQRDAIEGQKAVVAQRQQDVDTAPRERGIQLVHAGERRKISLNGRDLDANRFERSGGRTN